MGCDLSWKAKQDNLKKQKQASLFVHALLSVLGGKIGNIPYSDFEFYNGCFSGYFFDQDTLYPKVKIISKEHDPDSIVVPHSYETDWDNVNPDYLIKKKKLELLGFTAYFYGKPNAEKDAKTEYVVPLADYQFSFVFNNSPELPLTERHQLITIEPINDFRWMRYSKIIDLFKNTPKNPRKAKYAVYQKGGYVRSCSKPLLLVFYIVKQLYLPKLKISDDYNEFIELEKEMKLKGITDVLSNPVKRWDTVAQITDEFLGFKFRKQNIHPLIKKNWEVEID